MNNQNTLFLLIWFTPVGVGGGGGGRKKELRAQPRKTWTVTEQTFHLGDSRQATQSFYSPLSQVVTVWGFLLVRGVTLHTGYCPVVSHSVLQLSDFSPKPPRRKVKASFRATRGFTAVLCSSFIAFFFFSLNIICAHFLTQSQRFLNRERSSSGKQQRFRAASNPIIFSVCKREQFTENDWIFISTHSFFVSVN